LQPVGQKAVANQRFPNTVGDFKLLKTCGVEKALKEIRFWTSSDKEPNKCNGVELTFSNFKTVFLGKAKTGEMGRSVIVQKRVKRIEVEKLEQLKGKGGRRTVNYYDAANELITHQKYFTSAFGESETSSQVIPEGTHLVGVSLMTDPEGFITWVNFLVWPEAQQFS